ncbi:hypothetical protein CASFOL_018858 [Castilleja foliolosa]|uniref:Uncharacterized protein n=1 Tax=Castilleja foliolosa TaxID=1961234 RepID=A0ABD3D5K1_9LAMI
MLQASLITLDVLRRTLCALQALENSYEKLYYIGKQVKITLWPEKRHLIGDEVVDGHIVAITSTMVNEHNGRVQLESTYLTIAVVNPDAPQTVEHITRIRRLTAVQSTDAEEPTATMLDLKLN